MVNHIYSGYVPIGAAEAVKAIKEIIALIFTGICAFDDLKSRSISAKKCVLFAAVGVITPAAEILTGAAAKNVISELVMSMIPGIFLCIMSYFSGGAIGTGDGIFLLVCGIYMKAEELILISCSAWLLCSAAALFIILRNLFNTSKRKYRLPYISFLFPVMAAEKLYLLLLN